MTKMVAQKSIAAIALPLLVLVLALGCLVGCSAEQSVSSEQRDGEAVPEVQDDQAADPEGDSPRVLLAYFSRAGENFSTDRTDVGNTAIVAGFIEDALGCDAYEIVAFEPYPFGYEDTKVRAQQELADDARPALADAAPDLADYDVILLGCPIWYGSEPMAVRTFLESGDFTGKTIYPFTTHGGSGLGFVISDYRDLVPGATVSSDALAVVGSDAEGSQSEAITWLEQIGLLQK